MTTEPHWSDTDRAAEMPSVTADIEPGPPPHPADDGDDLDRVSHDLADAASFLRTREATETQELLARAVAERTAREANEPPGRVKARVPVFFEVDEDTAAAICSTRHGSENADRVTTIEQVSAILAEHFLSAGQDAIRWELEAWRDRIHDLQAGGRVGR